MIKTRLALIATLSMALTVPAFAQPDYKKRPPTVVGKAPFRADAWGPKRGKPGTRVWVDGRGFRRNMLVLVGGRQARVLKFSPFRVEFVIPRRVRDPQIVLRRSGHPDVVVGTFRSQLDPRIRKFGPASGVPGTRVEIWGDGFEPGMTVSINGRRIRILEQGPDRLVVGIPEWARTDYLTLSVGGYGMRTRRPFTVLSPAPVITGLSPGVGRHGTIVRVSGRNFSGREQLLYGRRGVRVARRGPNWLEFAIPTWADQSRLIRIRGPYGEAEWSTPFGLDLPPVVTRFTPTWGAPGGEVTVFGNRFRRGDYLSLAGQRLDTLDLRPTMIRARLPNGARSGRILVHRSGLTIATSGQFSVAYPPAIRDWGPKFGTPGAQVTFNGDHFDRVQVYYGERLLRPIRRGPNQLVVSVPRGFGPQPFRLVTPYGETITRRPFGIRVYPEVSGINPRAGGPGTQIRISGRHLKKAKGFYLGQMLLREISRSPREVIVEVPDGARSGRLWWEAWGARHGGTLPFAVYQLPVIDSHSPPYAGPGSLVELRGRNLGGRGARIYFGRQLLRTVRSGPGSVTVVIPRRARGEDYFYLDGPSGRVRSPHKFRIALPPRIGALSPRQVKPGETFEIGGGGYNAVTEVWVGKQRARIVRRGPGRLVVEVPRNVRPGGRWVKLIGADFELRSPYRLEVLPGATIVELMPRTVGAGTVVVIRGTGFGPGLRVFGDGREWPIRRINRRGDRIWVNVPANVRGRVWLEVAERGGYRVRAPYQLEVQRGPRPGDRRRGYDDDDD